MEIFIVILIVLALLYFFCSKETVVVVLSVFIIVLGAIGYIYNIVHLVHCDFKEPYKAEVIRTVGVIIPPAGAVVGYLDMPDETPIEERLEKE